MKSLKCCLFLIIYFISLSFPVLICAQEEGPSVEPKADKTLRQMSDYLNTLNQFTFHTENSIDTLLQSGQKIQSCRSVDGFVQRPDRLRVNIKGDTLDQELGHTMPPQAYSD